MYDIKGITLFDGSTNASKEQKEVTYQDFKKALDELNDFDVSRLSHPYCFFEVVGVSLQETVEYFKHGHIVVVGRDGSYWYRGKQITQAELDSMFGK